MENSLAKPGIFSARGRDFPLNRPYIMGILNVTPDSFSDGGQYFSPAAAIARAKEMEGQGADIIDVGGQSTRPGHTAVSQEEEWERLQAVLPQILREVHIPISVDTFYPWVAKKVLAAGVHIINDVHGFPDEMFQAAADSGCGCIIMCPTGSVPDIYSHVKGFFEGRRAAAKRHSIKEARLCFDPGIGFGKTYEENLKLIAHVERTRLPGVACLMAASRKRVTGQPCGNPPFAARLPATLAAHTAALLGGADFLRVHDVAESRQAALMAHALLSAACGARSSPTA